MKKSEVPIGVAATIIISLILFIALLGWGPGSQYSNLNAVSKWIDLNGSDFDKLKLKHPDLLNSKIHAHTGGNGMVGVQITGDLSDQASLDLYKWLIESMPPRPVHLVKIRSPPKFKCQVQPQSVDINQIWIL